MTHTTICVALIGLATLALAAPCEAQRSTERAASPAGDTKHLTTDHRPTGFMLGVRSVAVPGLTMPMEGADGPYKTNLGAGAGLMIGYGITETFSAYTALDVVKQKTNPDEAIQGSWGVAHFEIGARANLPLGGARTIPYITGGFGRRALSAKIMNEDGDTSDGEIAGTAFSAGAGIEHALSRSMSFDGGVDVGFGKFDHLKGGGDSWTQNVAATRSIRMRLGVTWRPGSRGTT